MNHVVVFCRCWVAWDEQSSDTSQPQPSSFQHDFQVQELQEQWQRCNPQIPLHIYRRRLQVKQSRGWTHRELA
jgi:hypothetical protein